MCIMLHARGEHLLGSLVAPPAAAAGLGAAVVEGVQEGVLHRERRRQQDGVRQAGSLPVPPRCVLCCPLPADERTYSAHNQLDHCQS